MAKPNNGTFFPAQHNEKNTNRRLTNAEFINRARESCKKHMGACEIGDGFVIIDTSIYEVKLK